MNNKVIAFKILFFTIILTSLIKSDYISLIQADKCENIVEIFVEEEQIRITFELGEKDYTWFKNIIPNNYFAEGYSDSDKKSSLSKFFLEFSTFNRIGEEVPGIKNHISPQALFEPPDEGGMQPARPP